MHSKLGISAFILSILISVLMLILFIIAGVLENSGGLDENSPQAIIIGISLFALLFAYFIAFLLGVSSLFQSNRKKMFGVLGAIIAVSGGLLTLVLVG